MDSNRLLLAQSHSILSGRGPERSPLCCLDGSTERRAALRTALGQCRLRSKGPQTPQGHVIPPEKVYYRFNFCFYQCLPSPIEILTSPRLDLRWPAGIHSGGVLTCWDMAFLHRACTSFVSSKLEAWARMKSLEKNATSPQCRQHRIGSNYLDGFAALGVRQRCNNGSSAPTFHAQRFVKN